jgi:hypothetical protein
MRFKPQTEEELQASFQLLEPGQYDFTVAVAEDKVSHAGNDYIFLKLQIWDINGNERLIFTNLALPKLLKHFCDVTGLGGKYQHGEIFSEDCLGKSGRVDLIIEQGKHKPEGGYYPDKNVVKDYIYKKPLTMKEENKIDLKDDDLPF